MVMCWVFFLFLKYLSTWQFSQNETELLTVLNSFLVIVTHLCIPLSFLPWSAMMTMLTQLCSPLWYSVSINRDNMSSTSRSWSLTSSLSGPPWCPAWSGWSKYKVIKSGFSFSANVSQPITSHTLSGNPALLWKIEIWYLSYVIITL